MQRQTNFARYHHNVYNAYLFIPRAFDLFVRLHSLYQEDFDLTLLHFGMGPPSPPFLKIH